MITAEQFFDIFLEELRERTALHSYYKFHQNPASFDFRKAYFLQRLQYIEKQITDRNKLVWDIGCGYGTSAIFLALNGFKVHGSTLEFYFTEIPDRLKYWSKFGDVSGFTYDYENLFDAAVKPAHYGYILVQDTLHHLEPIDKALSICKQSLAPGGKLVSVEENGSNLIQNAKLFLQRGNKRIITIRDQRLNRDILLGNENIRSLKSWNTLFEKSGLHIDPTSVEYIRYYFPKWCRGKSTSQIRTREQQLAIANEWKRERLFFGLSWCAGHQ